MAALLELQGIGKRFGDTVAVEDVDLALRPGERHALLGENGAGKSTLVKMLYGLLAPSAGRILWQGREMRIKSPAEARAMGIGMVFQHFSVFEALTVAENIALALPPEPMAGLTARIARLSADYGLGIDPARPVHTLGVGEKQRVEIVRCLAQNPRLLIMDEPTSVLTPQEAEALFAVLRRLSAEGCAILYITHRLGEVQALCDAATVLRRGRVVGRIDPARETAETIAALMIGREIGAAGRAGRGGGAARAPGPVRLRLDRLDLAAAEPGQRALAGVDLEVRGGEIVGIAGVAGEGQGELMAALTGERRARADAVRIDGRPVGDLGPTGRRLAGAAFVPEDRTGHAAVGEMGLPENVLLTHHRAEGLGRRFVDMRKTRAWAERIRQRFDVRGPGARPVAASLSGGNLQKFVVGREILRNPGVLVVSQPTWGVDAGAAAEIRRALLDLAEAGAAVLVISQDLDELFAIADRIAVIHHGRVTEAEPVGRLSAEAVGLAMAGLPPAAAA